MAEWGLSVDYSTIARWVLRYGPDLHKRIRRETRLTNRSWRVDGLTFASPASGLICIGL
jgi:transposase-like protein